MSAAPVVSVVIRSKDEEGGIGRVLDLLAGQSLDGGRAEVIVVDSGSRDSTVAIARRHGARIIEIPAADFTFGGALNTGCEAAGAETIVALSAHAFPPDERWLQRMLDALADERVACASGGLHGPDGEPLDGPFRQDEATARRVPVWGYTNGAGGFRAELWRRRPFRADMPASEDHEWAFHWMREGYVAVIDPALVVDHDHSHDPLPEIYERYRREWVGLGMYADLEPYGLRDLTREWWSDHGPYYRPLKARVSHRRAARLLGAYAGRRRARRHPPTPG